MTIEEKDNFILRYCHGIDCKDCIIEGICDSIGGQFTTNEEAIVNAYAVLTQHSSEEDVVNHPSHYNQGKFECIDVMAETFGKESTKRFCLLNAFK